MAYAAVRRHGSAYSTVHHGCRIRSPMLCSVTTTSCAGIRADAYHDAWASVFALKAGTVSSKDPRPATVAAPTAAPFHAARHCHRANSVHRKQYAGIRISARYCGNLKALKPKITTPAANQLKSRAF